MEVGDMDKKIPDLVVETEGQNESFVKGQLSSDYDTYEQSRREADEAFWALIASGTGEERKQFTDRPEISFLEYEEAERKVDDIVYQRHLARLQKENEKKQEEEWAKRFLSPFARLEEVNREHDKIYLDMYLGEKKMLIENEEGRTANEEDLTIDDLVMDEIRQRYIQINLIVFSVNFF